MEAGAEKARTEEVSKRRRRRENKSKIKDEGKVRGGRAVRYTKNNKKKDNAKGREEYQNEK